MLLSNVNNVTSLIEQLTQYRDQLAVGASTSDPSSTEFSSLFTDLTTGPTTLDPLSAVSVEAEVPLENYLLDDHIAVGVGKPNLAEFIRATGASTWDASEALYGTVGSNSDLRDWEKIMGSENPLAAARIATRQLYEAHGSDIAPEGANLISAIESVATYGALEMVSDEGKNRVYMTDKDGNWIREMGANNAQMLRNAEAFGVEKDLPMLLNRFLGLS